MATPITVPAVTGYTPNVTSVNPSFAINTDGTLINPNITITYTANQNNVATMSYVDATGNDLSQYASTPVALNASGTTDQPIPTSGNVSIPGYNFDHIEFNGNPITKLGDDEATIKAALDASTFTGSATRAIKFV